MPPATGSLWEKFAMSSTYSRLHFGGSYHLEAIMTTSKSGVIVSAWESGLDLQIPARPDTPQRRQPRRRAVDVRQSSAASDIPKTRRGSPPPLEDDIDIIGGLIFTLAFVFIVWL